MGEGEEGGGYSLYNTSNYISLKLIQIEEIEEIGVVIQSGGGGRFNNKNLQISLNWIGK